MSTPLPLKLVQANLALYRGDRLETLRLLAEDAEERGANPARDPQQPLRLWLEAQAQPDADARLERLRLLLALEPGSEYAHLASVLIDEEQTLRARIREAERQSGRIFGLTLWQLGAVSLLLIVLGIGAAYLLSPPASTVTPTPPPPTPVVQATLPPDRSVALLPDTRTLRYESGLLQVMAFEEESTRVFDGVRGELLTPVPGARFFALKLAFECREGICDQPPQARLSILTDDGFSIEARPDALLLGGEVLQAIALGRRSLGWVVFEIPLASRPLALAVTPISGENRDTRSIELVLPG